MRKGKKEESQVVSLRARRTCLQREQLVYQISSSSRRKVKQMRGKIVGEVISSFLYIFISKLLSSNERNHNLVDFTDRQITQSQLLQSSLNYFPPSLNHFPHQNFKHYSNQAQSFALISFTLHRYLDSYFVQRGARTMSTHSYEILLLLT